MHILDDSVEIEEVACQGMVPLIEQGITSGPEIDRLLSGYITELSSDIEAIVLGCTHYPLIRKEIELLWKKIHGLPVPDIIDPGAEAAKKFRNWMERHMSV